ncbi:10295_t:CDS:1, partial [Racocetra persica]
YIITLLTSALFNLVGFHVHEGFARSRPSLFPNLIFVFHRRDLRFRQSFAFCLLPPSGFVFRHYTGKASPNDYTSEILRASLSFVPKYGWTIESLSHGANSLGYPSVSHGLFPRGGIELIDWFLEDSRRKMADELIDKMDG